MTLFKQIALLVSVMFLVLIVIIVLNDLTRSGEFQQGQMQTTAQGGLSWENLGIRSSETSDYGLMITDMKPESDAERAGMGEGDIISMVDGKKLDEIDPEELFGTFEKEKTFVITAFTAGGEVEFEVKWTGYDRPMNYKIERMDKLSQKQEAMLNDWTRSQVAK